MLEVASAASVVIPRDQVQTLASLLVGGLSSTGWVARLCSYISIEPITLPSGTIFAPPPSASAGDQPASADKQQRRIDDWITAHPTTFIRKPEVKWAEREFHVFTQACLSRWAGNYLGKKGPLQPRVYDLQAEARAAGWPSRVVSHLKPTPFRLGSFVALLLLLRGHAVRPEVSAVRVNAVHVPGRINTLADALTRPAIRHRAWVVRPSLHRLPVVPSLPTMQW